MYKELHDGLMSASGEIESGLMTRGILQYHRSKHALNVDFQRCESAGGFNQEGYYKKIVLDFLEEVNEALIKKELGK